MTHARDVNTVEGLEKFLKEWQQTMIQQTNHDVYTFDPENLRTLKRNSTGQFSVDDAYYIETTDSSGVEWVLVQKIYDYEDAKKLAEKINLKNVIDTKFWVTSDDWWIRRGVKVT